MVDCVAWRVLEAWVNAAIWAFSSELVELGTSCAWRAEILVLIWASASEYLSIWVWASAWIWATYASE